MASPQVFKTEEEQRWAEARGASDMVNVSECEPLKDQISWQKVWASKGNVSREAIIVVNEQSGQKAERNAGLEKLSLKDIL